MAQLTDYQKEIIKKFNDLPWVILTGIFHITPKGIMRFTAKEGCYTFLGNKRFYPEVVFNTVSDLADAIAYSLHQPLPKYPKGGMDFTKEFLIVNNETVRPPSVSKALFMQMQGRVLREPYINDMSKTQQMMAPLIRAFDENKLDRNEIIFSRYGALSLIDYCKKEHPFGVSGYKPSKFFMWLQSWFN